MQTERRACLQALERERNVEGDLWGLSSAQVDFFSFKVHTTNITL